MEVKIVLYGIAKDIIGTSNYVFLTEQGITVKLLLEQLKVQFPKLKDLNSLLVAINDEYAELDDIIKDNDEVILVPPVSGG
jgi:molybdopterin synthase sulfur carrier subunit